MKKFLFIYLALFSFSALLFTSCGDDETGGTDPDAPSISIAPASVDDAAPGEDVTLTVSATAGKSDIANYEVLIDGVSAGINDFSVDGSPASSNPTMVTGTELDGFTKTITVSAPNSAGTSIVVGVTVTDDKDRSNTSEVVISTSEDSTPPSISVTGSANVEAPIGSYAFEINATKGGAALTEIKFFEGTNLIELLSAVRVDVNGSLVAISANPLPLTSDQEDGFTEKYYFNVPQSGTDNFTVEIVDAAGNSDQVELSLTAGSTLSNVITGQFYHMSGASGCTGGYDLVNDSDIASSGMDSNRDMLNTDLGGEVFTGSWMAQNGTRYVLANSVSFDGNSTSALEAAYAAGSPSASVSNPSAGDIYVAKLRGNDTYAVIRIDEVSANDSSCNSSTGNKGKISFSYKKG